MSTTPPPPDRHQLWCLLELAGSPDAVLDAERHLAALFGRRPSLLELVEEIMERRRADAPAMIPVFEDALVG